MSLVKRIELFYVEIPLAQPLRPAWYYNYEKTTQRMNLLRLTTDDGIQGISAGWALGPHRIGLKDWLPKAFLGINPCDLELVNQRLQELSWWGWDNAWMEPAFWDIIGKMDGKPVYQLLADEPDKVVEEVPVYCSTIESQTLEQRLASMEAIDKAGFKALKLCMSGDFLVDLPLVRGVREQGGEDLLMMLDACQGRRSWVGDEAPPLWKLSHAMDFAASVEPYCIEWLEEPIEMYAYGDLSVMRSECTIPIAGGRMNKGWHEFKVLLQHGSYDFYQPDATIAGGISGTAQLMDACARRDLHFSPNSGGSGISMLVNLHLYAAWNRPFYFEFPFEPGRWTPAMRDMILAKPLECNERGMLPVPQTPGLGIELAHDVLEQYGTCWLDVEA